MGSSLYTWSLGWLGEGHPILTRKLILVGGGEPVGHYQLVVARQAQSSGDVGHTAAFLLRPPQ